jgi:hypothetical protein
MLQYLCHIVILIICSHVQSGQKHVDKPYVTMYFSLSARLFAHVSNAIALPSCDIAPTPYYRRFTITSEPHLKKLPYCTYFTALRKLF